MVNLKDMNADHKITIMDFMVPLKKLLRLDFLFGSLVHINQHHYVSTYGQFRLLGALPWVDFMTHNALIICLDWLHQMDGK